jgi:hypothetical protein
MEIDIVRVGFYLPQRIPEGFKAHEYRLPSCLWTKAASQIAYIGNFNIDPFKPLHLTAVFYKPYCVEDTHLTFN